MTGNILQQETLGGRKRFVAAETLGGRERFVAGNAWWQETFCVGNDM